MGMADIRLALESHLNDLTGLPDIAWENVHYEPVEGTSYIRTELQMQWERPASMGPDSLVLRKGIFILSIFTPKNEGKQEADQIGDLLVSHFHLQTLQNGLYPVRTSYAERRAPIEWKTWDVSNLVISFYCYDSPL